MESLHCFFVFGWIKLKFGVRGNFRLLISNLSSETQYQFEILRKCHFSSLRSWFLAQHSLMNWFPWQQWMTYLQSFNFKNVYIRLPKIDISLVRSVKSFLRYSAKTLKNLLFFQLSHFNDVIKSIRRWRHQNFLSICKDFYIYYTLIKFHRHLTWNSQARRGAKIPTSLFRLAKSPVQIGLTLNRVGGGQILPPPGFS